MNKLAIIAAVAHDGIIGVGGGIPWRHKPDMKRFAELTTAGKVVIMGRKTWESLPPKMRPLPNRTNIVVTTSAAVGPWELCYDLRKDDPFVGAYLAASLEQALRVAWNLCEEPFVIGGESIYREALPLATRIELTKVRAKVDVPDGASVARFPFDAWPWPAHDVAIGAGWTCEASAAPADGDVTADYFTYRKVGV